MEILDLLTDNCVKLPITAKNSNFRTALFDTLDAFFDKFRTLDFNHLPDEIPTANITEVEKLINGIKTAVNSYHAGQPSQAYEDLKKVYNSQLFFSLIKEFDNTNDNFYRLRANEENYSIDKKELFHVPFDKIRSVVAQRYSIPGFPCLYLSNSIYLAWEELGRKPIEKLQAVRIVNSKSFNYLDLTTDVFNNSSLLDEITSEKMLNHLMTWPLIAACSFKAFEKTASFKPEYIIPQLLLQVIKNKGDIDAIRFSSSHVDLNLMKHEGLFYNYAIPVKSSRDSGYCDNLIKLFKITETVPWALSAVFSRNEIGSNRGFKSRNNIKKLELIRGVKQQYQHTPFGLLEIRLDSLETSYIQNENTSL